MTAIAVLVAAASSYNAQAATQHTTIAQAKSEIRRLWRDQAPRAMCIVNRESDWNPRAVSSTSDYGLFQLHGPVWAPYFGDRWGRVFDPVENVRMAYVIYRSSGFGPWKGGRYPC